MNARKILFPTDLSAAGSAALAEAAALARDQQATLLILHVEEPPVAYGGGEFYCGPSELTSELLQKMLERVVPDDKTIPCQHRLVLACRGRDHAGRAARGRRPDRHGNARSDWPETIADGKRR